MPKFKIALLHTIFSNLEDIEYKLAKEAGGEIVLAKEQTDEEFIRLSSDADALITTYAVVGRSVIEKAKKAKVIVRTGIGFNNIDIAAATEFGIPVANVPDYCFDEVSDHTIALALALNRQVVPLDKKVKNDDWNTNNIPKLLALRGRTWGLLGFGNIPKYVARKVKAAFNCDVIAYDPFAKQEAFDESGVRNVDLDTLFKESDILSVHAPLTDDTKYIVNARTLGLMKPTAFLVNTARGPLVNEKDLYDALKNNVITGAALDVMESEPPSPDNPLFSLGNIVITPHVAFSSDKADVELRIKTMQEAIRCALGEKPKNWVNRAEMTK